LLFILEPELSFSPVLLPCARLEDLLLLLGPPPISLLLAMVRPLKPAPLAALLLLEELDLATQSTPARRPYEAT
jgi:hypothetical protein